MSAPGEASGFVRKQRVDDDLLGNGAANHHAGRTGQQHFHRVPGVAQRRGQAPYRKLSVRYGAFAHFKSLTALRRPRAGSKHAALRALAREAAQARERELQLHAALGAHQLVPFVDHDEFDAVEQRRRIGTREKQGQALGCCDERLGQSLRLAGALARLRVAGAHPDAPVETELQQWCFERARDIGRERTHRRDPQQPQAAALHFARQRPVEQSEPDRVGLAAAGGRVQQSRAT